MRNRLSGFVGAVLQPLRQAEGLLTPMVLHRPAYYAVLRTWRKLAFAGVYAVSVVLATAVLIATLEERDPGRLSMTGGNGRPVTMIEAKIQTAAERALVSPGTAVVARERTNDF
jgi:hypothetical protein